VLESLHKLLDQWRDVGIGDLLWGQLRVAIKGSYLEEALLENRHQFGIDANLDVVQVL